MSIQQRAPRHAEPPSFATKKALRSGTGTPNTKLLQNNDSAHYLQGGSPYRQHSGGDSKILQEGAEVVEGAEEELVNQSSEQMEVD